jgi:outer membrane protein
MKILPSVLLTVSCLLAGALPVFAQAEAAPVEAATLSATPATLLDVFQDARAFVNDAQETPEGATQLGLAEVVQRSIETSGRIKAAEELIVQREAQGAQAESARKPQLASQLQLAYLGGLKQEISSTPLADLIIDVDGFKLGEAIVAANVTLQQVIYAGGKIGAAIRATNHLTESERLQREATLTTVALEATRAYYETLLAKALVRVANESAETVQRHLADANKALEVGAVSRFEVIRAQTELKAREADLARALTADDVSTLNLRRLTGLDGEGPLYLQPDWFTAATPAEALDDIVAEAMEKRPELNALGETIAAAQEQVTVKRADGRPQVAGLMQYQHLEGAGDFIPQGFAATVGVRWDWYTGGRVKNQIMEAQSQVRQLEHQRHELERAVALDVRQSHIRSKEAAQRILMQFATVQLAQEGQSLADLRFQQGVGTQTETLDADLALVQARTGLVQALGDYFIAQADLAKASGRGWQPTSVGAPENQ